jgi:hypothetical protein
MPPVKYSKTFMSEGQAASVRLYKRAFGGKLVGVGVLKDKRLVRDADGRLKPSAGSKPTAAQQRVLGELLK